MAKMAIGLLRIKMMWARRRVGEAVYLIAVGWVERSETHHLCQKLP
ncbi:MAG: hypothetical protein ACI8WB_002873 [Phenylobacterium sp.]|jgi:hypothetical protein